MLALLEHIRCKRIDRGHELLEELPRLLLFLLFEGLSAVACADLSYLIHSDAVLVVCYHWFVLEKVLNVLERGELGAGLLDHALLSQLLLLLLKDRFELLADRLWYHLSLLLRQELLLLYLLLLCMLLLLLLLLNLLLFLFLHQAVEETVHLVVGNQGFISCNLFLLFNHCSGPLLSVLLIYQVDVRVVPLVLLLEVLRQLRDLRRQTLVVLDARILQRLLLLLAHQLIELVLYLLARFAHVLTTVAQVPSLDLPLLLVVYLLSKIFLVLDLTTEECSGYLLGIKIDPLGVFLVLLLKSMMMNGFLAGSAPPRLAG